MALTDLADSLGVSRTTLYRWENGTARPGKAVVVRLAELGAPVPLPEELNTRSVPRLGAAARRSSEALEALRNRSARSFRHGDASFECFPSPYVRNGPPDQSQFHELLIDMQQQPSPTVPWDVYRRRLALVEAVGGLETAQHELEGRRATALSWNSNYGPHGWHRYVGRFPPHLVRALLNSWGMAQGDLILDPFVGSGTTLVESRLLGIPAIGIEVCPLSAMLSRAKVGFPTDAAPLDLLHAEFEAFYAREWEASRDMIQSYGDVFDRYPGVVRFANVERWFALEALVGVAISVQFAGTLKGYERDFFLTALSAKMRSIGNVDVDVVRAEYRSSPRTNVDVCKLVSSQIRKMTKSIRAAVSTHAGILEVSPDRFKVIHESALSADIAEGSISAIITSPPYGVESLSYLRTHLLSYRSLSSFLGADPYQRHEGFIGSEYLDGDEMDARACRGWESSPAFRAFFDAPPSPSDRKRHAMMVKFFEDLAVMGERMRYWLRSGGRVAFVIGNKRLGERVIPTAEIIVEMFAYVGLISDGIIEHKLKTNNSNSQVPWQERIIQNEYILTFRAH